MTIQPDYTRLYYCVNIYAMNVMVLINIVIYLLTEIDELPSTKYIAQMAPFYTVNVVQNDWKQRNK